MKTSTRFIFRKMKNSRGQMIGMGLLIFVATLFFTTILSFKNTYQYFTEEYFQENNYAQITLAGSFTDEDVEKVASFKKVTTAEPRSTIEVKNEDVTYRLTTITPEINQLSVSSGRLPENTQECVVLSQFARENEIAAGDELKIGSNDLEVVGIVSSPEYVYYVQDARTPFADSRKFGVVYVSELPMAYNQLVLETSSTISEKELAAVLDFEQYTKQTDQINYQMYEGDLGQFETFAFIFPIVFWLISFSIIFILLRRTILKEHKQIGIMKAVGHKNTTILKVYLMQFGFLGLIASFLGCVGSIPLSQWLLSMIEMMIELPNIGLRIYPDVWLVAIAVSTVGCLLAGILAMISVIRELPAISMKPRMPRMTSRSLFEKMNFLWRKLSFNSRYALKRSVRNKGRFFVMVIGIGASTALLCFSFGFNDSLNRVTHQYFDDFASYDLVVETEAMPLEIDPFSEYDEIDEQSQALQMPAKVDGEDYLLTIVDKKIDMLQLEQDALAEGVIIPEYYADKWQVDVGDKIEFDEKKVNVAGVIPLGMGLSIFTSYDYAEKIFKDLPQVYNMTYMRTDQLSSLKEELLADDFVFSTAEDDISSFDNLLENLQILIWLLIACGVILGVTVVLCINLMNLTVREFEYMFMNIMGYSKKKILTAIFKESFVQLCLAIPIGFVCGYLLLDAIKGEFSQNSFALYPVISMTSFAITGGIIILMSSMRIISANRFIDKLDIVEGLKVQED